MRAVLRAAGILVAAAVLAGSGGALWVRARLGGSLPVTTGERALAGLRQPVTIQRDALGVPTIRGADRLDVTRGLGFVHGQERFFQMDLQRRLAAGELAELMGAPLARYDRQYRIHRFREVARRVVARTGGPGLAALQAYADGVNAGLKALGARPFEYLLLRADPVPWRPEDSVLCLLAMFIQLQEDPGQRQSRLGYMQDALPPELLIFLAPQGTEWDAPLEGGPRVQPPVPGPEVLDFRARKVPPPIPSDSAEPPPDFPGSNNWAVAGTRTRDGRAIVANDMHLAITVPNVWYRVSLAWPGDGAERRVTGVTLPGTPSVAVGSNGKVAWSFTNSYGDFRDLVILEQAGLEPDTYLTPDGPRKLEHLRETIKVRGGKDQVLVIPQSIWGPVVDTDHKGRRRALRWTAHDPEALGFDAVGLETADTLDAALAAANRAGIPAQNFVAADDRGHIGWTIMGRIPRRVGFDGRVPVSWADGRCRWDGWVRPEDVPRIVDPPGGQLWTANARVLDGPDLAVAGDGGYDLGARARQIRDDLSAMSRPTEKDMLTVQLDDRALFLARWRQLLLDTLTPDTLRGHPRRAEFRRLAEDWGGKAAVDSAGYRMVRGFRMVLMEELAEPFFRAYRLNGERRFKVGFVGQAEGPAWALATQRPPNLLDPRYKTWDEQLLHAVDTTIERILKDGGTLSQHTWGRLNTPKIQHPVSRALPFLARWLDMPRLPIPGDAYMPRVQDRVFGASERFAVSPGHEADGYFMMPCGESGHPLSPHYRDEHLDWVAGKPGSFLPGPVMETLRLVPEAPPRR
ncbi:MAG: penicillin acylase family protein [Holophaga sp.]|jgi:penicillin amidase